MFRAYGLLALCLGALPAVAAAQGLDMHVATVLADSGGVIVAVSPDSGWFSVFMRSGAFAVRMDSRAIARWADSAAAVQGPIGDSTRIAYMDTVRHRRQAVTLVRFAADSNSPYRITGEDGVRTGTIVMRADSMRKVFAAMHGQAPILSAREPVYMDFQLHKQANPRRAFRFEYPPELYKAGISGEVDVTFIVDSTGRADMRSFRVERSTLPQFALAVKLAVRGMQFYPAEINGQPVAEVVRMPFEFNAGR
jgi:TonB family protein